MPVNQNISQKTFSILPLKQIQGEDSYFLPKSWGDLVSCAASFEQKVILPEAIFIKSTVFDTLILEQNKNLGQTQKIKEYTKKLNGADQKTKQNILHELQKIVLKMTFSKELEKELFSSWKKVCGNSFKQIIQITAVVFSENHTFLSTYKPFLAVKKESDVLKALKDAFAFFYSKEVEAESEHSGYEYPSLHISLMIEKIEETSLHGTIFPFEKASHFEKVVTINASYGKKSLKKPEGTDDVYLLSKSALQSNKKAVFRRTLGEKSVCFDVDTQGIIKKKSVSAAERNTFCLDESELTELAKTALQFQNSCGPCEIEWEKIGKNFVFYPPKYIHTSVSLPYSETFVLQTKAKPLFRGVQFGKKIVTGKIRSIEKNRDIESFQDDEIIVLKNDFFEAFDCVSRCSALILHKKYKDSSVVLEAREREIPVVLVNDEDVFQHIKNGKRVTVADGGVYEGTLPFEVKKETQNASKKTKTKIMMNIENFENAFELQKKQVDGVGIVRFESLYAHALPIHPLSLVNYPHLKDKNAKKYIEQFTRGFENKKECAVEKLASSIASIALAFAPAPVTVRLSDFASSEFSSFAGASEFKKVEPLHLLNSDAKDALTLQYREAFALQCKAIQKVRDEMGLTNVIVMVPFCPTPEQGEEVIRLMKECGLEKSKNGLQIHGRCEIPANFILAHEFIKIFDGFSIDINGLEESIGTKKTFGKNTSGAAIETLVQDVIYAAHRNNKYISFSSSRVEGTVEFSEFLIRRGIDSLSFAPDMVDTMKTHALELEKTVGRRGDKTHPGFLTLVIGVGALAATLIGMGSGCSQTLNTKVTTKDVSEYLPPIKIREEMEKKFQVELNKLMAEKWVTVQESGFANFVFEYPLSWKINHGEQKISLTSSTSTEFVNFFLVKESLITEGVTSTPLMVDGKNALRAQNFEQNGDVFMDRVEVSVSPKEIFVIEGSGISFEKIVNSVKFLRGEE